MIYIFVLLSITPSETHTIRYFSTHSDCLVEKYKVEKKINNPSIKLDCVTIKHKDI